MRNRFIAAAQIVCVVATTLCAGACFQRKAPKEVQPVDNVRHISVTIDRTPRDVYDYASNPMNLPKWAAGLARLASGLIPTRAGPCLVVCAL